MTTTTADRSAESSATAPMFGYIEDWQPEPVSVSVPGELLERYIIIALRPASPIKDDSGAWFCDLSRFPGVWAEGASIKECLDTLTEVLREWLVLKIADGDMDIPLVDDIDLTVLSRLYR